MRILQDFRKAQIGRAIEPSIIDATQVLMNSRRGTTFPHLGHRVEKVLSYLPDPIVFSCEIFFASIRVAASKVH